MFIGLSRTQEGKVGSNIYSQQVDKKQCLKISFRENQEESSSRFNHLVLYFEENLRVNS